MRTTYLIVTLTKSDKELKFSGEEKNKPIRKWAEEPTGRHAEEVAWVATSSRTDARLWWRTAKDGSGRKGNGKEGELTTQGGSPSKTSSS